MVDNELDNLSAIKRFAEKRDFKVATFNDFDYAMFNLSLGLFNGENSGLELIKKIPQNKKPITIMSTTGTQDADAVVQLNLLI